MRVHSPIFRHGFGVAKTAYRFSEGKLVTLNPPGRKEEFGPCGTRRSMAPLDLAPGPWLLGLRVLMTKFVVNEFSTSLFVRSLFSFFDVTMFAAEGKFKLARESFP